jgi:hypothetical protein
MGFPGLSFLFLLWDAQPVASDNSNTTSKSFAFKTDCVNLSINVLNKTGIAGI